jgi:hypothetical protein
MLKHGILYGVHDTIGRSRVVPLSIPKSASLGAMMIYCEPTNINTSRKNNFIIRTSNPYLSTISNSSCC